jgi:hypothetical protein
VVSASITLNVTQPSADVYNIYATRRDWKELEASWDSYALTGLWQSPGATGVIDHDATILGTTDDNAAVLVGSSAAPGPRTYALNADSVAIVQSWIQNPDANFGLIIQNYSASNPLTFASREADISQMRPMLAITFSANGVAP